MKPKIILISVKILMLIQKGTAQNQNLWFSALLLVLICSIHLIALNNGRAPGSPGRLTSLCRADMLMWRPYACAVIVH